MSGRRALLFVHVGVLLFGLAAVVGKVVETSPVALVWWRNLFATIAMVVLLPLFGGSVRRPRRAAWMLVLGAVLAVHWITFFAAMKIASVTIGLLGFATFPVFVALLEPLVVPGERFSWSSLALATMALLGIALLVPRFDLGDTLTRGAAVGVVSGALYAVLVTANRRLVADTSAFELSLWQNGAAFLVLTPFNLGSAFVRPSARDLVLLVVLGALLTGIAHVMFVHGLRGVRARTASIVGLLEPVYGIAAAALLLQERPAARTLLGGAVVLGAVVLSSRRRRGSANEEAERPVEGDAAE